MLGLRPRRQKQVTTLARVRYSESVSVGKSPTIRDIERLARRDEFQALLDLDTEGEPGQILSPNVEATWAHAFDLQHERVSIDVGTLRSRSVDEFLRALQRIAKPVYVHSLFGRRAAAMMIVHLALERGLSGRGAVAEGKTLGLDCEIESLRRFIEAEIDGRHSRAGKPATAGLDADPRARLGQAAE